MADADTILCLNPDPGKQGTRIPAWKFELIRRAILDELSKTPDGVRFKDLPSRIRPHLSAARTRELGSVSWHTTVVKLHMEAESEIHRVEGVRPQLLRKT